MPLGLSKLIQGMWRLDHKDFEVGTYKGESYCDGQLAVVIIFLCQIIKKYYQAVLIQQVLMYKLYRQFD